MNTKDTIAAIATAPGNSGIGIIRISGNDSISIADRIIKNRKGKKIHIGDKASHTISYGFVFDDEKCIDEVLVSVFRSPKSYTGEDCVEINCHGGMYVLNRILEIVIKYGARLAEPGEFTKRAFLNGRIDLTQSEAVMDIISSENEFSITNSINQLRGNVKNMVIDLRNDLLSECAFIEAALDDPEHYNLDGYSQKLRDKMIRIEERADELIKISKDARFLKDGIRVTIMGRPNAGKSSLLNMLLGYERAIVTKEEGTTRDVIEERISLDGIVLNLIDTAGIRNSDNEAEKLGIKKSWENAEKADLILLIIDSSEEINEYDKKILEFINDRPAIILLNKNDLNTVTEEADIKYYSDHECVSISAKNNKGLGELKKLIRQMFYENKISDNNQIYLTNIRQLDSFIKARDSIALVIEAIESGMTEDVFTVDMMNAYEELGKIIGESTDDALADKIFADFCMGK